MNYSQFTVSDIVADLPAIDNDQKKKAYFDHLLTIVGADYDKITYKLQNCCPSGGMARLRKKLWEVGYFHKDAIRMMEFFDTKPVDEVTSSRLICAPCMRAILLEIFEVLGDKKEYMERIGFKCLRRATAKLHTSICEEDRQALLREILFKKLPFRLD